MIQKLRRRVALMSLLTVLTLLAVVVAGMNLLNYISIVQDADHLLEILSGNQGRFPTEELPPEKPFPQLSPEARFETRFFTVLMDKQGHVLHSDTQSIAAVDDAQAEKLATRVFRKAAAGGFVRDYRYLKDHTDKGIQIIFLDMGRKLDAFRNFLWVSILISVCAYMIMGMIIWWISPRIIRPIAESYEKQKRFITDAGHELKTPLTVISADADVLEMDIGENEWLEDIKKQTRHLSSLTSDLVYLAKLEEGQNVPVMLEFPVSDVVLEAASSFQAPALAKGKTLTLNIEPMLSCRGVEKNIRQLTAILLDNALKYSPERSEIVFSLTRQGKSLRLSCRNKCENALTQQDAKHLFERFYRADPSRNSGTGGHGLGLAIANAIMTAHGGRLQAAVQEDTLTITAIFNI